MSFRTSDAAAASVGGGTSNNSNTKHQQQRFPIRGSPERNMHNNNNSPPSSPLLKNTICMDHPQQRRTSTGTNNNNTNNNSRLISPSSPSRSWDEGESRPPSPGGATNRSSPRLLQPRPSSHKQQHDIFRRAHSSPTTTNTTTDHHPHEEDYNNNNNNVPRRCTSADAEDTVEDHPTLHHLHYSNTVNNNNHRKHYQPRSSSPSSVSSEPTPSQRHYRQYQPRPRTTTATSNTTATTTTASTSNTTEENNNPFEIRSVSVAEPQRTSPLGIPPILPVTNNNTSTNSPSGSSVESGGGGGTSLHHQQQLTASLHDKTIALENAKMIIASLEKSNGAQAADWKRKLQQRDRDNAKLTLDLADTKRTLDALATELKQVQTIQHEQQEHVSYDRLRLAGRLEANASDLREAVVVLEATQDPTAVQNAVQLISDSATALRQGIELCTTTHHGGEEDTNNSDPYRIFREVETKKKRIRCLEQSLQEQMEQNQQLEQHFTQEKSALVAEIKILRRQCTTNIEVLTKKERELVVLRDSLRVEDDVGYISDDEEDDDDDDDRGGGCSPPPPEIRNLSNPDQMEALATLLATGGNPSFESSSGGQHHLQLQQNSTAATVSTSSTLQAELLKARKDHERAIRDLKVEKESLSNAKMIISSLERANKSMMEDLRARLQDSQGAVASLMEKSLECEQTNAHLRAELDSVRHLGASQTTSCNALDDIDNDDDSDRFAVPPPLLLTETID